MDPASLVRQLLAERPSLRDAMATLTATPLTANACNEVFAALIDQQRQLHHKRARALALLRPRGGLWEPGMMMPRHIPDVWMRIVCEIAEIPHVTNATTEWLDKMEKQNEQ